MLLQSLSSHVLYWTHYHQLTMSLLEFDSLIKSECDSQHSLRRSATARGVTMLHFTVCVVITRELNQTERPQTPFLSVMVACLVLCSHKAEVWWQDHRSIVITYSRGAGEEWGLTPCWSFLNLLLCTCPTYSLKPNTILSWLTTHLLNPANHTTLAG